MPLTNVGSLLGRTCALLLTTALLAGCGGTTAKNDSAAASTSVGAETIAIAHKFGETKVPANAKRVVTVGWNDQDDVLALGVVPVGTRSFFDNYNDFPWVKTATDGKGVPVIPGDEINFEAIAKAKPDVIFAIYETIDKKTYDQLSQIAPTVVQSDKYPDEETPWDVQLLTIGKALGKETEAQGLVDKVNSKISETKTSHPEFAGKTLVADYTTELNSQYLLPAGDPRRQLFDALGFNAQHDSGDVSDEKLSLLEGDVLFVNGLTTEQVAGSPAFSRLKVVQDGRTLYAGSDSTLSGALTYSGPEALLYALNVLTPQLSNALTGKPVADLSNS
ncbi:iron-siderophore ABC transporter substrate-binding protein [Mycolicibacterium sp. J2]|uniref:iron-siderophore ABC transporter substrate-binding protein n=1 Tax=Mycolicibacterium sp. J2 TaxID=2993511 RepID=UPI00224B734B|nr:iron-siderophore ABC transporter substrate-binding protein [Mycolicibacterium sp. J2]MCX2712473.1 iron-siderophore ABC transporter substrate-binding protein [Mycolicibacterium sp. J2]